MRLDPDHITKLARARDGDTLKVCPRRMRMLTETLSVWEEGLINQCLTKALTARRLSKEQRALLALFAYVGEEGGHETL